VATPLSFEMGGREYATPTPAPATARAWRGQPRRERLGTSRETVETEWVGIRPTQWDMSGRQC
jgi:hypothetical protein